MDESKVAERNVVAQMNFFFLAGMVKSAMNTVDCAGRRERGRVAIEELEGIDAEVTRMLDDIEHKDKELKLPPFMGRAEK